MTPQWPLVGRVKLLGWYEEVASFSGIFEWCSEAELVTSERQLLSVVFVGCMHKSTIINAQGAHNTTGHITDVSRGHTSLLLTRSPTALRRRGRPRVPMKQHTQPGSGARAAPPV